MATLTDKERNAAEAERLLHEPLLVSWFARVREETLAELLANRGASAEHDTLRARSVDRLRLIDELRSHLAGHVKAADRERKARAGVA